MDLEVTSEFKKVYRQLKCKANCNSVGTPSLPLNSIQYNSEGAFFGDSLFTRNATTKDTIIGQSSGTVAFGLQQNSDIVGIGFTGGSFNYYTDSSTNIVSLAGTGDETIGGGFPGTSQLLTINTVTQDQAVLKTFYDTGTSEMLVLGGAINGNINSLFSFDSVEARLYYTNDNGVTSSTFIAENGNAKIFTENAGVEYFARLTTGGVFEILNDSTATNYFKIDTVNNTITVNPTLIPTYADDAAANGAGLTTGRIYKTVTGGSTFLKLAP